MAGVRGPPISSPVRLRGSALATTTSAPRSRSFRTSASSEAASGRAYCSPETPATKRPPGPAPSPRTSAGHEPRHARGPGRTRGTTDPRPRRPIAPASVQPPPRPALRRPEQSRSRCFRRLARAPVTNVPHRCRSRREPVGVRGETSVPRPVEVPMADGPGTRATTAPPSTRPQ